MITEVPQGAATTAAATVPTAVTVASGRPVIHAHSVDYTAAACVRTAHHRRSLFHVKTTEAENRASCRRAGQDTLPLISQQVALSGCSDVTRAAAFIGLCARLGTGALDLAHRCRPEVGVLAVELHLRRLKEGDGRNHPPAVWRGQAHEVRRVCPRPVESRNAHRWRAVPGNFDLGRRTRGEDCGLCGRQLLLCTVSSLAQLDQKHWRRRIRARRRRRCGRMVLLGVRNLSPHSLARTSVAAVCGGECSTRGRTQSHPRGIAACWHKGLCSRDQRQRSGWESRQKSASGEVSGCCREGLPGVAVTPEHNCARSRRNMQQKRGRPTEYQHASRHWWAFFLAQPRSWSRQAAVQSWSPQEILAVQCQLSSTVSMALR